MDTVLYLFFILFIFLFPHISVFVSLIKNVWVFSVDGYGRRHLSPSCHTHSKLCTALEHPRWWWWRWWWQWFYQDQYHQRINSQGFKPWWIYSLIIEDMHFAKYTLDKYSLENYTWEKYTFEKYSFGEYTFEKYILGKYLKWPYKKVINKVFQLKRCSPTADVNFFTVLTHLNSFTFSFYLNL